LEWHRLSGEKYTTFSSGIRYKHYITLQAYHTDIIVHRYSGSGQLGI